MLRFHPHLLSASHHHQPRSSDDERPTPPCGTWRSFAVTNASRPSLRDNGVSRPSRRHHNVPSLRVPPGITPSICPAMSGFRSSSIVCVTMTVSLPTYRYQGHIWVIVVFEQMEVQIPWFPNLSGWNNDSPMNRMCQRGQDSLLSIQYLYVTTENHSTTYNQELLQATGIRHFCVIWPVDLIGVNASRNSMRHEANPIATRMQCMASVSPEACLVFSDLCHKCTWSSNIQFSGDLQRAGPREWCHVLLRVVLYWFMSPDRSLCCKRAALSGVGMVTTPHTSA